MHKKIYLFSFATALWLALSAFYSGPTEAPSRTALSSSGGLSEFYPAPPPGPCDPEAIVFSTDNGDFPAGQMTPWTVPAGVTEIKIVTQGGEGGYSGGGAYAGGQGAYAEALFPVTPGHVLYVIVAGTAGTNAGGGGSGVYDFTAGEVLIVAAGGGGGALGQGGQATEDGGNNGGLASAGGTNGGGGSGSGGGGGGGGAFSPGADGSSIGSGGGQGTPNGGDGGISGGAFGFGGGGGETSFGLGGGGGYSGGGGGNPISGSGGGGGSFVHPTGTNTLKVAGTDGGSNNNAGYVTICYTPASCPPGDVELFSQEQVDAFVAAYPNCTEIAGKLTLGNDFSSTPINDITGLSAITSIAGDLVIGYTALTNLDGLDNLATIGGDLGISSNDLLANIDGFSNLTSVSGEIGIFLNTSLTNLNGLSNLNSVAGMFIAYMPALTSLAGLENITSYGEQGLGLLSNPVLSSLDGLNDDATFGGNGIGIFDNPMLSACESPAICNHLAAGGPTDISGNAAGCSSVAEVEAACFPCDIAIDNIAPAAESCPGANDGGITVSASCTTCSGIEYSVDGVNFQPGNTFSGLAPNGYTVTVRDTGDPSCEATDNTTVDGGPATDSDGDGTPDCNDGCPNDPGKVDPGTCGCGTPEPGANCDDGNSNTINDQVQADCSCQGIQLCPAGSIQLSTDNNDFPIGQMTQWTVPAGVTEVTILTKGGDGNGIAGGAGAGGGAVAASTLPVNPGDVLHIIVAGTPSAGFPGSGGGGTGVYNFTAGEVLIAAGGGGGGALGQGGRASEQGGRVGNNGGAGGTNGSGGGGIGGGGGGGAFSPGADGFFSAGGGQGVPNGGNGGLGNGSTPAGGFGFGGGGSPTIFIGNASNPGGGGGYSGGGGGVGGTNGGGGGGGSYVHPSGTNTTITAGVDGASTVDPGAVTICYIPGCDISIDNITPSAESCPGANDGSLSVGASCTTCSGIEYSIDWVNFQASNTFSGLAPGAYTVTARDAGDASCEASDDTTVNGGPTTDSDGDGTADCNDGCPNDPDKVAPGICGCGTADDDTDHDGTVDCNDGCPNDPDKIAPGICGCGVVDVDSDGDGTEDCNDGCPSDPDKIAPGVCGCGLAETDSDGDGTEDCNDGCPNDPDKIAPGICGCGVADVDSDGDGTEDCNDGCPSDPDKIAPGVCGCGVADTDSDGDGTEDCNDGCPNDPDKTDPGACGCGVADTDTDGDGLADCIDACPNDPDNDADGDGLCADADNCPTAANAGQADLDLDGLGDACDPTLDVCGAIAGLIAQVEALNLSGGLENALTSKLENALSSFGNGNNNATTGKLGAFINQVNAKSGKDISASEAAELIAAVQAIIDAINAGTTDCNASARSGGTLPGGGAMATTFADELRAFPNPFTQQTTLQFYLPADGYAQLSILSIHGQEVAILADGQQAAGLHRVEWADHAGLPAGVYFARLQTDSGVKTLQLVLAK